MRDRGCRQELLVSRKDGSYAVVFDEQTREFGVRPGRLDIEIHGSNCWRSGVELCRRGFSWNAGEGRLEEAADSGGGSRVQGPVFQVVPLYVSGLPGQVSAAIAAASAACAAAGGKMDGDPAPLSVPDLDGDGARDWIVDPEYSSCEGGKDRVEQPGLWTVTWVFVTRGKDVAEALGATNLTYEIDVGRRPAVLYAVAAREDCGGINQGPCARAPMIWNPFTHALEEPHKADQNVMMPRAVR
ncbi:hypothetical protein BH11PSE2_BH11PSE2_16730 [soil metagenome]